MKPPLPARALLWLLAGRDRRADVLGDLEEAHRLRVARSGALGAYVSTCLEALDVGYALVHRGAFSASWVDVKLGLRMLLKYPGLTFVGGVAIAFAVAAGAGSLQFASDILQPSFDVDEGDRIVWLQLWDRERNRRHANTAYELGIWRDELTSVHEIGAFLVFGANVGSSEHGAVPSTVAEVTAAALSLARTPPHLGRPILDSDEAPDATPVVLLGYETWQSVFAGEGDIVGRTVLVGGEPATVIGVMPPEFAFPTVMDAWVPLRIRATEHEPGTGPGIIVLARLNEGVHIDEARAELRRVIAVVASDDPATYEHVEADVRPYPPPIVPTMSEVATVGMYGMVAIFAVALIVLACGNVALLVFARTASREAEIVVRSALGAGRGRIVGQIFVEALVLALVATGVGLVAANVGLKWVVEILTQQNGDSFPFWVRDRLTTSTMVQAGLIAVIGAAVAGVPPALKVTRGGLQQRLQRVAGRGAALNFGGVWSAIIVMQIAGTVFFAPIVVWVGVDTHTIRTADAGVSVERFLTMRLETRLSTERGEAGDAARREQMARFNRSVRAFADRLREQSRVGAVTLAEQLPGGWHPRDAIEVEGVEFEGRAVLGRRVEHVDVATDFFEVMGTPVLAGRTFMPQDASADERVVVVNEEFVERVLGGANAVGRRIRYPTSAADASEPRVVDEEDAPWHRIVGVVRQIGLTLDPDLPDGAGIYHPLPEEGLEAIHLAAQVSGDREAYVSTLRSIAMSVDPTLELHEVQPLENMGSDTLLAYDSWFRVLVIAAAIALLLSNAGIYAVMSFAVSRRTREIGVRRALGAGGREILWSVFRRSLRQVIGGIVLGFAVFLSLLLATSSSARSPTWAGVAMVLGHLTVMTTVCLAASVVPCRRAMRIEPTDALREEG